MTYRYLALALVAALLCAAPASAHQGNPNFLTQVDQIQPSTPGISIEVINRDDQLEMHNESGKTVVIEGYVEEPYARLAADGTVSVNTQSPAYYLNDDRFANVEVPDGVDGKGTPEWKEIDKTGRFAWHDHRMHYMGKGTPSQVKDPDVKQVVQTWEIPMTVDDTAGSIDGTLFWTPNPKAPMGFIIVGSVVVLIGCAAALIIRRRRDREDEGATSEAW